MKVLYMTGYKAFEFGIFKNDHEAVKYIKKAMKQRLLPLVEDGLEWAIISGQLGTELWGAEVVFDIQEEYSQLKLGANSFPETGRVMERDESGLLPFHIGPCRFC